MHPALSRIIHAFRRYFSVMPVEVAPEVKQAAESASKAVAAAVQNPEANACLAEEMSRLNTIMRPH